MGNRSSTPSENLGLQREFALGALNGIGVLVAIGVPISLMRWVETGFLPIYLLHVLVLVWVGFVFLRRKHLPFSIIRGTVLSVMGLIGAGAVLSFGISPGGWVFLLLFVFLVAILFGPRWAIMAAGGVVLGCAAVAALSVTGHISLETNIYADNAKPMSWVANVITLIIACLGLILPTARLQKRLLVLSLENEKGRKEAETANQTKSSFLANMSHEIRTPMNGVVGMAEVLSETGLDAEQQRMLRTIRSSSHTLLRIIDDILDITKIEAGKIELENEVVRLETIFEDVLQIMRPIAQERRVRLWFTYDPALPKYIRADAVRIRQILTNLVGNAVKFSARPEPREPGLVHLSVTRLVGARLSVAVTDNGVGMSEQVLQGLFQPFYQGEASTSRVYGGTGLGLVISKTLANLMGGDIWAESQEKKGATFTVELPFDEVGFETDEPDLHDLKLIGITESPELQSLISGYCQGLGGEIIFVRDPDDLVTHVNAVGGAVYVVLGLHSAEENKRLRDMVAAQYPEAKFVGFSEEPEDLLLQASEHCHIIRKHPILPSEFRRALALMAGRLVPEDEAQAAPSLSEDKAHTASETVLLVEDNKTNQEVIAAQLKMLAYKADIAENGAEGLEKWKTGKYHLVLTDCHMPEMDGFDMTNRIRAHERTHGLGRTTIIAITANAMKGEAQRCFAAGMDDYLSKPVALADLKDKLERSRHRE